MDAELTKATLAEKQAHTELMRAQARLIIAQAVATEKKNKQ